MNDTVWFTLIIAQPPFRTDDRWKKYSFRSSPWMKPKPLSAISFTTVPFRRASLTSVVTGLPEVQFKLLGFPSGSLNLSGRKGGG